MSHEVADQIAWESSRPLKFNALEDQLGLFLIWEGPHPPPATCLIPRHTTDRFCGGLAQLLEEKACYGDANRGLAAGSGAPRPSTQSVPGGAIGIGEQAALKRLSPFGARLIR